MTRVGFKVEGPVNKRGYEWGLLQGYPGLLNTAKKISWYIPYAKTYVEPFAGMGRLCKYIRADLVVLNDKSDYAVKHLHKKFKHHIVTQKDFMDCMLEWDSAGTFFLLDPPWRTQIYSVNEGPFIDRPAEEYYKQLFEIFPSLKGDWILCAGIDNRSAGVKLIKESGYNWLEIESDKYYIYGYKARVLLCSNKPFTSKQALITP